MYIMTNNMHFVIAHYKEDLSWTKKLNLDYTYTIIDDGCMYKISVKDHGFDPERYKIIEGDHSPQEASKYLTYIIDNYDQLPDRICFTQGDPIYHSPDFIQLVNNYELHEPMQPLTLFAHPSNWGPDQSIRENNIISLNGGKIWVQEMKDDLSPKFWKDFFLGHLYAIFDKLHYPNNNQTIVSTFLKDFNIPYNTPYRLFYAACFSVSRDKILAHPKETYIKLRDFVYCKNLNLKYDYHNHFTPKMAAVMLEMLWGVIFGL